MIIELIKFLFERWRRWKYKEDYEKEAKIKVNSKNHLLQYKLEDKETFAFYLWPNLVVTSIELWSTGEEISHKDKALILIDLLDHIYNEGGKKAIISIEKNHPDKEFWEKQSQRLKYKIEKVDLFDKEEEFQSYVDELSKAFQNGKTLEINGEKIDNRQDLEKILRDKK